MPRKDQLIVGDKIGDCRAGCAMCTLPFLCATSCWIVSIAHMLKFLFTHASKHSATTLIQAGKTCQASQTSRGQNPVEPKRRSCAACKPSSNFSKYSSSWDCDLWYKFFQDVHLTDRRNRSMSPVALTDTQPLDKLLAENDISQVCHCFL